MSVTTIIVTYNRKDDLCRCIEAVLAQTVVPDNLLIVNNASTDNTENFLYEKFGNPVDKKRMDGDNILFLQSINNVSVYLINKSFNTGGAGGLYTSLKLAYEYFLTDYYWMMDDDGYPTELCLEKLLESICTNDYVMPISIDIDDNDKLSWPTRKRDNTRTEFYRELKDSWGEIMNHVTPFNGVLLTKRCVSIVGFINKNFFIWGDDYEHYYRCLQAGIVPITIMNAKFLHPAQKVMLKPICFGLLHVAFSESELRMVCMIRNWTYIYLHYDKKVKIPIKFLMYTWLFLITRKWDIRGWILYCHSVMDGIRGNFTRHLKYLPK